MGACRAGGKHATRGAYLALALIAAAAAGAHGEDFFDQEWLLNPRLSHVYMQTVKNNATFETHQFTAVEGGIDKQAEASVRIELASIETGIDVRNVRMRFLLFETFKFPYAQIGARLDKGKLQTLATETRVAYPLDLTVDMHADPVRGDLQDGCHLLQERKRRA
jgi:OmpA-OmpF porin, OOP family